MIGMHLACQMKRRNIHLEIEDNEHALTQGGATLNFGIEGSVGPVFYADGEKMQIWRRLRDGGGAGFALR